jgi:hypothetical protein
MYRALNIASPVRGSLRSRDYRPEGGCSGAVIVQNHGCPSGACGWRMMRPTTGPLASPSLTS